MRNGRWAAVLLVAGAILVASVVETPDGAGPGPLGLVGLDKWLHALAYAALALALAVALADARSGAAAVLAAAVAVAYGLGIELLQAALPWRSFDPADLAADAAGAVAVLAWRLLARRRGP